MMDGRSLRKPGDEIILGGTAYKILGLLGRGGSSVVYRAVYPDRLNEGQFHDVLIKELYPCYPKGKIYRDERGWIRWEEDVRQQINFHKLRFKQGNLANLKLLKKLPSQTSGNLNSYEAYGTYYSVLSVHGGYSLENFLKERKERTLLEDVTLLEKILNAVEHFHKNRLLHLDISPDNVLLLPEQAMLIDYNSVWDMDDVKETFQIFIKKRYSAPEICLQEMSQVGYASDLYSVCAVFCEMITGEKLSEKETAQMQLRKRLRKKQDIFQDEPESAVHHAIYILVKGLHEIPGQRYQSAKELRRDLEELRRRIEGQGVSHSMVWESSRQLCQKAAVSGEEYLVQKICMSGEKEITAEELYEKLKTGMNILLKGPGGMGKTRLLHKLWQNGTKRYRPAEPVVYYLSLKEYQEMPGEPAYIQRYLLSHLCFSEKQNHREAALRQMERLFDHRSGEGVNVILLLDGLNEAGSRRVKLLKEIERLGKREGTGILVTERTDEVKAYGLYDFQTAHLCSLEMEKVSGRLSRAGIWPLPKPEVMELLRNPMMLGLYLKTAAMQKEDFGKAEVTEKPGSADDLTGLYLHQLYLHQQRTDSGDGAAQLCNRYILFHLLPEIAWEMKKRQVSLLAFEEMYKVVKRSFQQLKQKNFGRSFPEYFGKSRQMLEGIADASQWFDFSVEEQLIERMGLLVKGESGSYGLVHDIFQMYLVKAAKDNQIAFIQKNIGNWGRYALAVLAAAVLVTGGILSLYISLEKKKAAAGRYTEEEQFCIDRLAAVMQADVGALSSQVSAQREILEAAGQEGVIEGVPEETEKLRETITYKLSSMENLIIVQLDSDLVGELIAMNPDFPIEQVQSLCAKPEEMKTWMEAASSRLEEMLCSQESVFYGAGVREQIVQVYEEYLDAYVKELFYEYDYVLQYLKPEQAGEILDDNRYTAVFRDYFTETGMGTQDAGRVKAAMDQAAEELEMAGDAMNEYHYKMD